MIRYYQHWLSSIILIIVLSSRVLLAAEIEENEVAITLTDESYETLQGDIFVTRLYLSLFVKSSNFLKKVAGFKKN